MQILLHAFTNGEIEDQRHQKHSQVVAEEGEVSEPSLEEFIPTGIGDEIHHFLLTGCCGDAEVRLQELSQIVRIFCLTQREIGEEGV